MNMLAGMVGITPDKMQAEMEGFANLAKSSSEALGRIEKNTQNNNRLLRLICAKLEIEAPHDASYDHDAGPGSGGPGPG